MRFPARTTTSPSTTALVATLVAAILAVLLPAVVGARTAGAALPTAITLAAPGQYADRATTLTVALTTSDGTGVAGAPVVLERWDGTAWQLEGSALTTGSDGRVSVPVTLDRTPARNRLRAGFAGDDAHAPATAEHQLSLLAYSTVTTITGPATVVDEQSVVLRLAWRTVGGTPIPGPVVLQRLVDGRWRTATTVTTNAEGYVDVRTAPRVDSRWRAVGYGLPWASRSVSGTHVLDNLPPGAPVRLPAGAPRPRIALPAQARASTAGAHPVITTIPDSVWRNMVGRSWHRGCPVGRAGLRLLRINYWDYAGYRRRGEIVAAASVIRQMAGALSDMYAARLPIRAMRRVDRFGWSSRLNGADDYRSMAAGNTSAFNCRWVVGRPGVRSPHSYGRSLDINTWENPYRSRQGWVPNTWWPRRSDARVAWRSRTHAVVRIMARHGLRWTYGTSDSHHFDAVPRGGRPIVVPGCEHEVCH